jgi:hypothetical protein
MHAWTNLLDDWKRNGGGLRESIRATRTQIAHDEISAFAKMVRSSWQRQDHLAPSVSIGSWPVTQEEHNAVWVTIRGFVPKHCEAPIWLDDWLWNELQLGEGAIPSVRRLSEMPSNVSVEYPHSAASWIIYWLFVRVE